ncbi:MAG: S41 family peptidase [Candidatus Limivivens sp.]|nr:S41 family peptidase [Candidatus Limivivens sp.]
MEKRSSFLTGAMCGICFTLLLMLGIRTVGTEAAQKGEPSTAVGAETESEKLSLDLEQSARKLQAIEDIVNQYYYDEVDSEQVEAYIYKGMVAGLGDPYAAYYTEEELEQMLESSNGSYDGIGVTLTQDRSTGLITIVRCYENTPAAEAGLQAGDILKKVNGEDAAAMDLNSLVSLIRTAKGETVTICVSREGTEEELEFQVERRKVEIPTVAHEMLDHQIGYIQIAEFDTITEEQFIQAKEDLESQGMEKLIIDLRSNLGGVLDTVCQILRQILPEGLIVYTEDKDGARTEYRCDGAYELDIPLAVLINGYSASASEIFAGAVQDYGIGTLVGTKTYGKGIVQQTVRLTDGSAVKLTIAKYFTPLGNDIHGKGIEPDVEVELEEQLKNQQQISKEEDNQLQKAIEILEEEHAG